MDFLAEYDDMGAIPQNIAVSYKFLNLFKVVMNDSETEKRGLHWSTYTIDSHLSDEVLLAFKTYLKAKKSELRKENPKTNCGKILWFFYQKLLDVGAFDIETRKDILGYMELCAYIIF
jgi:hypothetical protein